LLLTTKPNLVGCSAGSFSDLLPFNILSTEAVTVKFGNVLTVSSSLPEVRFHSLRFAYRKALVIPSIIWLALHTVVDLHGHFYDLACLNCAPCNSSILRRKNCLAPLQLERCAYTCETLAIAFVDDGVEKGS